MLFLGRGLPVGRWARRGRILPRRALPRRRRRMRLARIGVGPRLDKGLWTSAAGTTVGTGLDTVLSASLARTTLVGTAFIPTRGVTGRRSTLRRGREWPESFVGCAPVPRR